MACIVLQKLEMETRPGEKHIALHLLSLPLLRGGLSRTHTWQDV